MTRLPLSLAMVVFIQGCGGGEPTTTPPSAPTTSSAPTASAPPTTAPTAATSEPPSAPPGNPPSSASIGAATMKPDGTILLQLRAEGGGAVGDALLTYPPGHKDYQMVLKHIGGIKPGESKPVPPFP